jgi:hypothetical protein
MASTLELLNFANNAFWANKPTVSLYNSTAFSVANITGVPITWNSSLDDNWNGHSASVNPSRYTAQVAGIYRFGGCVTYAPNATGYRMGIWYYNGAEYNTNSRVFAVGSTVPLGNSCPMPPVKIRMAVGDYVELWAYQSSGGALNTADGTWFDGEFVHF